MDNNVNIFRDPPREYYPVPWWAWTGKMEKKEMRRQLKLMFDQGIYEFFIFPIYGLEYPVFLKDSWWAYIDFTIEECKKLDMKVWIYDDLNWPSGNAGGWAVKEHPEYRRWKLNCEKIPLKFDGIYKGDPASEPIYMDFRSESGEITSCNLDSNCIWRNTTGKNGTLILISKILHEEVILNSIGTSCTWGQKGSLDLLNEDAVKCWMSYIHESYWKRFKKDFGKTLKGFFYDEPYGHHHTSSSLPWTRNLFGDFRKKYGYDLIPNLPKLLFNDKDNAKVRFDFWTLITEYFSLNFSKQIADWCEKRNVEATGHATPEEMTHQKIMLATNGDIQQVIRYLQVPGCDMLEAPNTSRYGNWLSTMRNMILTVKRPSSTARYNGAKRVMCETFGVRPWNGDMREQKLVNDWLAAMGINLINDNSLIYTISDFRKNAISGKHFTQPWWKYYKTFTNYCARISLFAASGYIDAELAIIFPATTHMAMTPMDWDEKIPAEGDLADVINLIGDTLLRSHIDFEYICEYVIKKSTVSAGTLNAPNSKFKVLVLPKMHVMDEGVYKKISEFIVQGGKVIAAGGRPEWIISSTDKKLRSFPEKEKLPFIELKSEEQFAKDFMKEIFSSVKPRWSLSGKGISEVVSCMRIDNDRRLLLVANQLPGDRKLSLRHSLGNTTELLDVENGGIFSLPIKKENGQSVIDFTLADHQSFIFIISDEKAVATKSANSLAIWKKNFSKRIELKDKWDFSVDAMNHYQPETWLRLDPSDRGLPEKWHSEKLKADPRLESFWFPVIKGKTALGFSPEESPFYWLAGGYNAEFIPDDLSLIVDENCCEAVFVNGKRIAKSSAYSLWDQNNRIYKIAKESRKGQNAFYIKVRTSPWFSPSRGIAGDYRFANYLDKCPMFFLIGGSFAVGGKKYDVLSEMPSQVKIGSWTTQGFPCFTGAATYKQRIKIDDVPSEAVLHIDDAYSVVKAEINGINLGVRAWKPFCFDAAKALREGDNEIVLKVTNSLGNILRRYYGGKVSDPADCGLLGKVYIAGVLRACPQIRFAR